MSASIFEHFCLTNRLQAMPASPLTVVRFLDDMKGAHIDVVWREIKKISLAHSLSGLADPTLGAPVALAVSKIANVTLPRSWNLEHKSMFGELPYPLQLYISAREQSRDTEIRRMQNEVAEMTKEREAKNGKAAA